jgi:hypothetical protein
VTDTAPDPSWDPVDAAGGIDLLLTDAALGLAHRLRLDSSLLRLAAGLARRPGLAVGEAAPSMVGAGRSGGRKKRPRQPGRKGYPIQCAAPGTYVHDH